MYDVDDRADDFWWIIIPDSGFLPVTIAGRGVPANRALADPPV